MPKLTFKQAARRVLTKAQCPLHAHEIARRALADGLIQTTGKTPQATMEAPLCVAVRAPNPVFVRTAPRTFALRDPNAPLPPVPTSPEQPDADDRRIRIPHFPSYEELMGFLTAVVGLRASQVTGLRSTLSDLRGTPQSNVDWSDPNEWMADRLTGDALATARAIWSRSKQVVNPRHTTGVWLLARNYDLLSESGDGTLALSARGRDLLDTPTGDTVRDIDDAEGLLAVLRLVGENGPAGSAELLESWADHLHKNSRIRSDSATRSYLYQRLRNLLTRQLVRRSGQQYAITAAGLAWLGEAGDTNGTAPEADPNAELIALVQEKQDQVRDAIREILADMDPYAFEHLIHDLLVEMGYVDVEVTSPSNDKGVDVVGKIELGITSVKEVIQVKRHRRTIQRKDLDALRGCLHRFQAVRGTIITTSRFSSGTQKAAFEPGAAPITLIDGEKLVELLAKHEVGVKKRKIEVWELDESAFQGDDT